MDLIPVAVAELDENDAFSSLNGHSQEQPERLEKEQVTEEPESLEEPTMPSEPVFSDMEDHPAREAVERLNAAGVISGVSENRYDPDRPMTRQELAVVFEKSL